MTAVAAAHDACSCFAGTDFVYIVGLLSSKRCSALWDWSPRRDVSWARALRSVTFQSTKGPCGSMNVSSTS